MQQVPPVPEAIPNQEMPPKKPGESVTQSQSPYSYYPSSMYPWPQYSLQYLPSYPSQHITPPDYAPPNANVPTAYVSTQPEYEGILVPYQNPFIPPPPPQPTNYQQQTQQTNSHKDNRNDNKISPARNSFDLAIILQALLPPSVLQMIVAWANFILNSFTVMAFAGMVTSAICSLTPICTLTFGALPLSVRKKFIGKTVNEDGSEVTTIKRVRRAVQMVSNALDKYEKLQKTVTTIEKSLDNKKRS